MSGDNESFFEAYELIRKFQLHKFKQLEAKKQEDEKLYLIYWQKLKKCIFCSCHKFKINSQKKNIQGTINEEIKKKINKNLEIKKASSSEKADVVVTRSGKELWKLARRKYKLEKMKK